MNTFIWTIVLGSFIFGIGLISAIGSRKMGGHINGDDKTLRRRVEILEEEVANLRNQLLP